MYQVIRSVIFTYLACHKLFKTFANASRILNLIFFFQVFKSVEIVYVIPSVNANDYQ